MNFFIVSGLSGSGKSIVLQALEDLGFYCVDNLPAALLPHFARELVDPNARSFRNVAVAIDARNRRFLGALSGALAEVEALGLAYSVIFLEAEESVLLKRFKETRRKHPLTDKDTPLIDGIRLEKTLLEPLSSNASRRIDTTRTSAQELRRLVFDFASGADTARMTVLFQSFGYKHGTPLDADYVFDVRCLPNPYWVPGLRDLNGFEPAIVEFLERHEQVNMMFEQLCSFLDTWLPCFEQERRSYMTVAIGCTGGRHRSVYLVERLARHYAAKGLNTQVRHRELA